MGRGRAERDWHGPGYLPGSTMASAQPTVPGEASLQNRGGGYPCSATHPSSADFENIILLNKGLMGVLEFVFPSFSALEVRDASSLGAL